MTVFSASTWENLGLTLLEAVVKGDKEASGLLATWGLLRDAVGGLKSQQDVSGGVSPRPLLDHPSVNRQEGEVVGEGESPCPLPVTTPQCPKAPKSAERHRPMFGSDSEDEDDEQKPWRTDPCPPESHRHLWQHTLPPPPASSPLPPAPSAPPLPTQGGNAKNQESCPATTRLSVRGSEECGGGRNPVSSVMAMPRGPRQFWQAVKDAVQKEGNWNLVEHTGRLLLDVTTPSTVALHAYPVITGDVAAGNPKVHTASAWKIVQDLQKPVSHYGVNSPATMQLLHLLTMDTWTPFDISQVAQIIFQPVPLAVFHGTWRAAVEQQGLQNTNLPQHDPRVGNGPDVLMGTGQYASPQQQAQWSTLV